MSKYYVREDDVSRDKVMGPMMMTIRANTAAAQSTTNGDFSPLITDTNGKLWVNASGIAFGEPAAGTNIGDVKFGEAVQLATGANEIGKLAAGTAAIGSVTLGAGTAEIGKLAAGTAAIGKLAANNGVDIGDVDVTSVVPGTGATNLGKAEDTAHSTGDVGVMPLAVRDDVNEEQGDDGDYVALQADKYGKLRVAKPDAVDVWRYAKNDGDNTADLTATNMAAAASNTKHCLTDLAISIYGAAIGDDIKVTIKSGSTLLFEVGLSSPYAGTFNSFSHSFATPLFGGTNENLTIECDGTWTGAGAFSLNASGYSIPA